MLILKNVKRVIDIRTVTLRDKAKEVFGCAMADITADGQVMIAGPMAPHVLTDEEEARFRLALNKDGYLINGKTPAESEDGQELPLAANYGAPAEEATEKKTKR